MKRGAFVLLALLVSCLAVTAADPVVTVVAVDPNDFRQPIPDPQGGLSQKYDGQIVRFSGVVSDSSVNKKTKQHQAVLHFNITQNVKIKGKNVAVVTEQIPAMVTFLNEDKALQQAFTAEKAKGAKGTAIQLTVQGKGTVQPDGSLYITEAVIVPQARTALVK